jgi:hypothetical protein
MFICYLTLITNVKMSEMIGRCKTWMIMDIIFTWCGVILIVCYGFDIKPRAPFVRSCACEKHENVTERHFISFPGLAVVVRKRNPPGVLFKLFSDSLNMKRLPSDLAIFTLAKVFEVCVFRAIV